MANITGDVNFPSNLNQALSASTRGRYAFLSAFNMFLSITACLGNALILVSFHKVSSIHPPTKLLFRCLAVTDLGVGLILQPLYATRIVSSLIKIDVNVLFLINRVRDALSWIFCGLSILTSTAISVDRLLALLLGLRYRHVVTLRRVRVAIICFWFIGVSLGSIHISRRSDIARKAASAFIPLPLVISIFCYTRIFFKLQRQQAQVQIRSPQGPQEQANEGEIPLNIARYKKSVSSVLWMQLALVACYAPWAIAVVLSVNGISNTEAWLVTLTLIYFNSSLNPILYCCKIRSVRQAVKDTIRQLKCSIFIDL